MPLYQSGQHEIASQDDPDNLTGLHGRAVTVRPCLIRFFAAEPAALARIAKLAWPARPRSVPSSEMYARRGRCRS
jgi:hypothetical protein